MKRIYEYILLTKDYRGGFHQYQKNTRQELLQYGITPKQLRALERVAEGNMEYHPLGDFNNAKSFCTEGVACASVNNDVFIVTYVERHEV